MTFKPEPTEVGEQTLIDGVCPVTMREKLTARTTHPMVAGPSLGPNLNAPQKSCDIGLFDEVARSQIDLCDLIAKLETSK
ncbi:hypothetical protein [Robiginitomaculum antarcticum]|uniref:hypothetical protein n=1 Tax=Robiginitomaculum antarcticum TaxID=437507 RepID=UPI0003824DE6|nr:hypothetical protein [Robiginitomaculum antarcticum]